jgi:hypothetical protein
LKQLKEIADHDRKEEVIIGFGARREDQKNSRTYLTL